MNDTLHEEIVHMFNLSKKVALVTGGARQLGRDAASILAAAGCSVAITSRDLQRARQAASGMSGKYGVEFLPLQLDHRDYGDVCRIAAQVQSWKGGVDILINNAGGGSGKTPAGLFSRDPLDMADLIATNLTGVLYCCQTVGKMMVEKGTGKIINIASVAGVVGRDRRMYAQSHMSGQPIDYAAAKAGVIGMTRDLAAVLSPQGVCVNAISPGGFARDLPEQFMKDYSNRTPLMRMGRDGVDLKGAILFLASSASDYVTGHNLVVDGGFSVWQ